jgi:hypothetical protein
MAYDSSNLTMIHGGNGFNLWHYKSSTDLLATIAAYGYMTGPESGSMVKANDRMTVVGADASAEYVVSGGGEGRGVAMDYIDGTRHVRDDKKVYIGTLITQTDLLAGTSHFVGIHVAGYITRMTTVVKKAVTTGGVLTVELAGTAVPGLSITIEDAATVGTVQSAIPDNPYLAANLVPAITAGGTGDIELVGDSSFATAGEVYITIEISPFPSSISNNVMVGNFINQTDLMAATSHFIIAPVAGYIVAGHSVVKKAIASTGGSLTVELGGTAVNGLAVVVANSAAVGDNDTDAPSSLTHATAAVTAGQAIELVGDAAFNSAGELWMSVEINPTTDTDVLAYCSSHIEQVDLLAGTSHFVTAPVSGYISKLSTVVKKAVTTGGAITLELGGEGVLGISNTIADSATVGSLVTSTPTKTNDLSTRVAKGDAIEIVGDTAFATAGELWVLVEITPA